MTTSVTDLNACLTTEVLSTAFSMRCDPTYVLPAQGSWSCARLSLRDSPDPLSDCIIRPLSTIPSQVRRCFEKGSQLRRPRYGLHCTIRKRLAENFILMSHLASKCGLQEETGWPFAFSSSTGSYTRQNARTAISRDRAGFTLDSVALTSQTLPWTVKVVNVGHLTVFVRYQGRNVLQVHKWATIVEDYMDSTRWTRIPIALRERDLEKRVDWARFDPRKARTPALVRKQGQGKRAIMPRYIPT